MAAPRESFESRQSVSKDARGARTGERLFYTDYRDPTAAITDATYSVIPAYNSTYPGDSAMKLDKKSAEVRPDGTYQVRLLYSTDQRYSSNNIDKTNATYYSWQGTTVKAQEYYWVVVKRKLTAPNNTATTPTPSTIWQGVKAPITERRQALTLSIRTANVSSASPFSAIAAQTEKLHLLGGQYWLFIGGEATRSNQSDWEFTYRWELDIGTLYIEAPADQTEIATPPIEGSGYGDYSRPPYCDTFYVDNADPKLYLGKIYATPRYQKDDDGWRSLPGISGVTGL